MKRPIEQHWLYRLTNSERFCGIVGLGFSGWCWYELDSKGRVILGSGLAIAAFYGIFLGLRDILRRRRGQPIDAQDTEREGIGRAVFGEIIPPVTDARRDPPRLRRF